MIEFIFSFFIFFKKVVTFFELIFLKKTDYVRIIINDKYGIKKIQ